MNQTSKRRIYFRRIEIVFQIRRFQEEMDEFDELKKNYKNVPK